MSLTLITQIGFLEIGHRIFSSKSFSWKVGLSVPGRSIPWVGDGPHLYPRDRPNLLQKCPQNNQSRNMARLLSFSMQVSDICVIRPELKKMPDRSKIKSLFNFSSCWMPENLTYYVFVLRGQVARVWNYFSAFDPQNGWTLIVLRLFPSRKLVLKPALL